jgi:hypothetical protein
MDYRINKQTLLDVLGQWNGFLRRKIHLIACGRTVLTLLASYDISEDRISVHLDHFLDLLGKEELYSE